MVPEWPEGPPDPPPDPPEPPELGELDLPKVTTHRGLDAERLIDPAWDEEGHAWSA